MITEVVSALIWQGEKFMICQRPPHKARGLLWEFVGGKAEPGETKEQALIRECQEELAIEQTAGCGAACGAEKDLRSRQMEPSVNARFNQA